jgi:hypothetical protein
MDARQQRLLERLGRALEYGGTQDINWVVQAAREGRAQIWEGADALVVTEVIDYPLCRSVRIAGAAGSLGGVMAMDPMVTAWAASQGATRMEAGGRPGWDRVGLPAWGWERRGSFWTKSLEGGDHA